MKYRPLVHVGYPKAASTYLHNYMDAHPDVQVNRVMIPQMEPPAQPRRLADDDKVQFCTNEKMALNLLRREQSVVDNKAMFAPGSWDAVSRQICINPEEMARRIKILCPDGQILIVIRDQADWLSSAYRYYLPTLPIEKRSFRDFCATLRGITYLEAGHYDRAIGAYADVFGVQNLFVVRYELLLETPDAFIGAICRLLGVEAVTAPRRVDNPSSSVAVSKGRRSLPILEKYRHLSVSNFGGWKKCCRLKRATFYPWKPGRPSKHFTRQATSERTNCWHGSPPMAAPPSVHRQQLDTGR